MRRKINSLSAAAMGKTGWRANPDPSIPVVPTHHILHDAWYNELQGEISRDRSTYLSVHLVPHYMLMWSAIGYKKDKCMAYICEQSEKQLLSFLQHCFPPALTGDPTIPNFSMHCCCMQLWNHVPITRGNTWAHGLMQNILKAAKRSHWCLGILFFNQPLN